MPIITLALDGCGSFVRLMYFLKPVQVERSVVTEGSVGIYVKILFKEKEDERSLVGWLWKTPNFLVVRHLVQLNH
ncbi:unnamed protein product [Musa banksii]